MPSQWNPQIHLRSVYYAKGMFSGISLNLQETLVAIDAGEVRPRLNERYFISSFVRVVGNETSGVYSRKQNYE
jgi:hypothetical protein